MAAEVAELVGHTVDEADMIVERAGGRLYDIARIGEQDPDTVYVYARVIDGVVRGVVSVGYPRPAWSVRTPPLLQVQPVRMPALRPFPVSNSATC